MSNLRIAQLDLFIGLFVFAAKVASQFARKAKKANAKFTERLLI